VGRTIYIYIYIYIYEMRITAFEVFTRMTMKVYCGLVCSPVKVHQHCRSTIVNLTSVAIHDVTVTSQTTIRVYCWPSCVLITITL
jgi:hypothetical protein